MGTEIDTLEIEAPAVTAAPEFVAAGRPDLSAQLAALLVILKRRRARMTPEEEDAA